MSDKCAGYMGAIGQELIWFKGSRLLSNSNISHTKSQNLNTSGLDTYYFLNLAVGQPSNNMDLSEIEIYLGMMIIFFPFQ